MAVLLAACLAVYWVGGGGGLLFAVLVAIYEQIIGKRALVVTAALLAALCVPWIVGMKLVALSPERAYGQFLLLDPGIARAKWPYAAALFIFFLAVLVGPQVSPHRLLQRVRTWLQNAFRLPWPVVSTRSVQIAIVVVGIGAAAWLSPAGDTRTLLEMDYLSQHERWAEMLEVADRIPSGPVDPRSNRNIILALYHTGRLGDHLFRYPQTPTLHFCNARVSERNPSGLYHLSRLFLYLGQVNYAERNALDALDFTGELPALLQHLAVISRVKDQPDTAWVFLTALSRNPFQHKTAEKLLRQLESDSRGDKDPRVRLIRSHVSTRDRIQVTGSIEDLLLNLLADNAENRMAYDLLMAQYLLAGQSDKVVENLGRLATFGDSRTPRHYQEAVLVSAGLSARNLGAIAPRIDPEVIREAELFAEIVRRSPNGQAAAVEAIEAGLGDTYPFYLTYHLSGFRGP